MFVLIATSTILLTIAFVLHGCDADAVQQILRGQSTSQSATTTLAPQAGGSSVSQGTCSGKNLGTYSWDQSFWRAGNRDLLNFLESDTGLAWNCGDVYINIADYSNWRSIAEPENLLAFARAFRQLSGAGSRVLWMTYGDVVERNGVKMKEFVATFEQWLHDYVDSDTIRQIMPIGLSYDVEHVDPKLVRDALIEAKNMKARLTSQLGYPSGSVLLQATIQGAEDEEGTRYVMEHTDSALMMLYRNYINDPTGKYQEDSNIVNRMYWMLTAQCADCLKDDYFPHAKITVMVEASCKMGRGCGKLSFCAHDGPGAQGGVEYMWNILTEMDRIMQDPVEGYMTPARHAALFNPDTPFAVHDFKWSRCFYGESFYTSMGYDDCDSYNTMAGICRTK
ncbi:hypothetical protein FOZ63_032063 [Perkinsus olseni]|nr:hypothetical protein FOZ63_032063 [Perkinsus olseni]